jgi:glycosyltransferase involved in cell wall biosynthesis
MTSDRSTAPPRVSVVVPAYNRAHLLGRTLDSVIAQTVTDWELVVSDDGSTDGTADVAERYARADPRIRVVHASNAGVAEARNRGFVATDRRSEYVTFLDSDDLWLPDTLEAMTRELDDRPDLVAVYGLARCIDSDDRLLPGDDMELRMRERFEYRGRNLVPIESHEPTTFAGLVYHNYPATPGLLLIRRAVLERVGAFDPDTDPGDDWDMAIRISRLGSIGFLDRLVLEWRRHPETLTQTSPRWRKAHYRVRAKAYAAPQNTPEQTRLVRTAYLGASRDALGRGWSDLRHRRLGPAARAVASAADISVQFAAVAVPHWARSARAARAGVGGE